MAEIKKDGRFYIGKSKILKAGKGLFAKASLAKGERLRVPGVLIKAGSLEDECTRYADRHKFRVGKNLLIPIGYGGMSNHSLKPNMEKVIEGKQVYLRALRDVRRGEELCHRYNESAQKRLGLKKPPLNAG